MRVRGNSLPRVASNIRRLLRAREFNKKIAVRHKSNLQWAFYKAARNKVHSELHMAKKNFFCEKFNNCAMAKDPKQSWKLTSWEKMINQIIVGGHGVLHLEDGNGISVTA